MPVLVKSKCLRVVRDDRMRHAQFLTVKLLCLMVLISAVQGCGSIGAMAKRLNPFYSANDLQSLQIVSSKDANYGYAVAMDVVFIADPQMAKIISQYTATQWFEEKKQLYPSECPGDVCVQHLEIMPANVVNVSLPDKYRLAGSVLVFVWYLKESKPNRFNITRLQQAKMTLQYSTIRVENVK